MSTQSDENKLLPCPFCGSHAHPHAEEGQTWIECDHCGASGMIAYKSFFEAFTAWNRRAPEGEAMSTEKLTEEQESLDYAIGEMAGWIEAFERSLADPDYASACDDQEKHRAGTRDEILRLKRLMPALQKLRATHRGDAVSEHEAVKAQRDEAVRLLMELRSTMRASDGITTREILAPQIDAFLSKHPPKQEGK